MSRFALNSARHRHVARKYRDLPLSFEQIVAGDAVSILNEPLGIKPLQHLVVESRIVDIHEKEYCGVIMTR